MISLNLRFVALLSLCIAALALPADLASDHKWKPGHVGVEANDHAHDQHRARHSLDVDFDPSKAPRDEKGCLLGLACFGIADGFVDDRKDGRIIPRDDGTEHKHDHKDHKDHHDRRDDDHERGHKHEHKGDHDSDSLSLPRDDHPGAHEHVGGVGDDTHVRAPGALKHDDKHKDEKDRRDRISAGSFDAHKADSETFKHHGRDEHHHQGEKDAKERIQVRDEHHDHDHHDDHDRHDHDHRR